VSDRLAFGLFEFDPADGTLTREGTLVRLQPQPARVLALLLERAGTVVTREELRQGIWTDGTFVDFERGLNFCIAQIRSALGDSAESPRFIETLPRRGYRFIAPIRRGPGAGDSEAREFGSSEARRFGGSAVWRLGGAAAVVVALGLIAAFLVVRSGDERVRVAVVPFDNETGLDDFDRIARAVADATVARLATPERVGRLSVIGNAAALHQPRAFRDLETIGAKLKADYIVLAQMKRDAAGVRLIAHLIRVSDQGHVWAHTYDRPAFTLDVQAEIAESIAREVARCLHLGCAPLTGRWNSLSYLVLLAHTNSGLPIRRATS
jgi:DNA-binding winged helix-turn-helix (wHTH) protein/TolB-like protein